MTSRVSDSLRRIASGAALTLLVGCTTVPIAPRMASAQGGYSSEESQLFYELLVSELAIRRGDLAVAAEGYLRATERTDDPRVAERATQLAVYYQQWDAAKNTAERWLKLDPSAIGAHETLAQIHLRQGDVDGAVKSFISWIDTSGDVTDTLMAVNQVLQRDPDMELSYEVADRLAAEYPEQALAHVGKARMAVSVSLRDEALKAANDALTLDSTLVDALLVKAQVQISLGQSPDAIETLQAAVTEQPDSLALHMGFAQLLVESGLDERAGPVLDRAAELSEKDPDTWLRLGLLALSAGRNDQAKTFLTGVLEADAYNERAHFYLGRIADRRHDHETAISHYDAVPQGEFYLTARIRSAELTADGGNVNGGLERIRELGPLTADPAMKVQLLSAESRVLQQGNRFEEAIAVLDTGLDTYPKNTELLYARALAAEKNGNHEQLEADLAELLTIDPS